MPEGENNGKNKDKIYLYDWLKPKPKAKKDKRYFSNPDLKLVDLISDGRPLSLLHSEEFGRLPRIEKIDSLVRTYANRLSYLVKTREEIEKATRIDKYRRKIHGVLPGSDPDFVLTEFDPIIERCIGRIKTITGLYRVTSSE